MSAQDQSFKYLYGPVYSWRLGNSLGIDPISQKEKICNLNCVYCQLGKTTVFLNKRKVFIPTQKIIDEIKRLPNIDIDYITFSGRGEPTLAKNLGKMIYEIKKNRTEKVAVITNSLLFWEKDIYTDLILADFILAKLDCHNQELFDLINSPQTKISFNKIVEGIKRFRNKFLGKFALQIMMISLNKKYAPQIADIARSINPDEVQITSSIRKCIVKPLSKGEMLKVKKMFKGLKVVTVYDHKFEKNKPLDDDQTKKRHGIMIDDLA